MFLTPFRIYEWLGGMDRAWVLICGLGAAAALVLGTMERKWWTAPPSWADDAETRVTAEAERKRLSFSPAWVIGSFVAVMAFSAALGLSLDYGASNDSGVTTAYRAVHLLSGVSPVISLLLMVAGFYWWFWQSLSGLALLGNGRPVLPRSTRVRPGFNQISDAISQDIDRAAMPFPWFGRATLLIYLLPLFLVIMLAFVCSGRGCRPSTWCCTALKTRRSTAPCTCW